MKINLFNKKAEESIIESEVLKIIIAVLCILILVYLAYNLYTLFSTRTALEQSKVNLDEIDKIIVALEKGEIRQGSYLVQSPKDWWIIGWPYKDMVEIPKNCKSEKCLCICPATGIFGGGLKKCEESGICKDTSKKIKTIYDEEYVPILIEGPTQLNIRIENNIIIMEQKK